MPEKTWAADSQVLLYRYLFSNEFDGNVKIEAVPATVHKPDDNAKVCLELEYDESTMHCATSLKDAIAAHYLEPKDLGIPKAGRYYMVILDEDNLELAKKLVLDNMKERIEKLVKDIDYTRSRMQDVRSAVL